LTAGQLLAGPRDEEERSARDEAKDALRNILRDGPVPAADAKRMLAAAGIAEATWRRAKADIGITSRRVGNIRDAGYYVWELLDIACSRADEQPIREQAIKARQNHENGHKSGLLAHSLNYEQAIDQTAIERQQFCQVCGRLLPLQKWRDIGMCETCARDAGMIGATP
jgi:hypothetical protein